MRCSSCEPLLDRYLEGTVTPRQMIDVRAHLCACSNCRALLEEIKAVDGLLATPRIAHLPENFTFAIMAEVNSLPAPRPQRHAVWGFLAFYSAAAWIAAVTGAALSGRSPLALFSAISALLTRGGASAGAFTSNLSFGFSHTAPALAAFGAGVLSIDLALACAFALLYYVVRPRLAARLAAVPETRP